MTLDKTFNKYSKQKVFKEYFNPHVLPKKEKYNFFIIIPAYNEESYINDTLKSISCQDSNLLNTTLIVIVINNADNTKLKIKNNNQRTFHSLMKKNYNFEMILLDCYSSHFAFPNKVAGVGLARKVGMDFCISYSHYSSLFCSLDADTIIHKKYLKIISKEYVKYNFFTATVNFLHQKNNDYEIQNAIIEYELLIKDIANNLYNIGSRYGFVSMGSTIICTMEAYISIGGIPPKKATEDFYFLQKLAKYKYIHKIKEVLVYPSSRAEERVYLGTGFRMSNIKKKIDFSDLYVNPKAYVELENLYNIIKIQWNHKSVEIISSLAKNNSKLYQYLKNNNFVNIINKMQKNAKNQNHLLNQFHGWFDNLKIYKFLKYYDKKD
tara:strand:+ start:508 stop:1644 length:1137 start_codon:yes stop_codon:yes gene_type:complete